MKRIAGSGQSLTRRVLWVMISTLTAVAIGLGAVGTVLIERIVEQSFDRLLGASVQEIVDTVAPERGDVTFDIPPSAFGILENSQRDNVYYSVRQGRSLLAGYSDLPVVNMADSPLGEKKFAYALYSEQRIRIAAEQRYLPRMPDPVVVQVAQTTGERRRLALVMLSALYLLELCFVVVVGLLVWPSLKWSLQPVNRLRDELESRPADHANFEPLDLRNAPNELVGLVNGFNHLLQRLEAAVAGMRQFTADASHQMRTPLAVLKTHLALLNQYVSPGTPGVHALEDVHGAVLRLESLLTRLLSLAYADEAARGGISRSSIDLRDVITQVVGELIPLAAQRDINLSVDVEPRPARVHAESIPVAEILTNLLDNAIRYTQPGGTVNISVHETERRVTLSVEDDGPGVPEAELKHIFERFYRLQRDQAKPGTGLGLSIVKTLSEALHTRLWIGTPASGHGLKVSVTFEAARQTAPAGGP